MSSPTTTARTTKRPRRTTSTAATAVQHAAQHGSPSSESLATRVSTFLHRRQRRLEREQAIIRMNQAAEENKYLKMLAERSGVATAPSSDATISSSSVDEEAYAVNKSKAAFCLLSVSNPSQLLFVSPQLCELLGRPPKDLIGRPWSEVFVDDAAATTLPSIAEAAAFLARPNPSRVFSVTVPGRPLRRDRQEAACTAAGAGAGGGGDDLDLMDDEEAPEADLPPLWWDLHLSAVAGGNPEEFTYVVCVCRGLEVVDTTTSSSSSNGDDESSG